MLWVVSGNVANLCLPLHVHHPCSINMLTFTFLFQNIAKPPNGSSSLQSPFPICPPYTGLFHCCFTGTCCQDHCLSSGQLNGPGSHRTGRWLGQFPCPIPHPQQIAPPLLCLGRWDEGIAFIHAGVKASFVFSHSHKIGNKKSVPRTSFRTRTEIFKHIWK